MDSTTTSAILLALCVTTVAVASGPLVPSIDYTQGSNFPDELYQGFGTADGVTIEKQFAAAPRQLPANATLAPTDEGYVLRDAAGTVAVDGGSLPVGVRYDVSIPALNRTWRVHDTVARGESVTRTLVPTARPVPASAVTEDRYEGVVTVTVEYGNRSITLANRTVSVGVDG